MEKIELTRAEINALHKYAERVKEQTINAIFNDVEEMLRGAIKTEDIKALYGLGSSQAKHLYAGSLCLTLLADLQKIERKYKE